MEFKIVVTSTENIIVAAKDQDEADAISRAIYEMKRKRLSLGDNLRVEVVPIGLAST